LGEWWNKFVDIVGKTFRWTITGISNLFGFGNKNPNANSSNGQNINGISYEEYIRQQQLGAGYVTVAPSKANGNKTTNPTKIEGIIVYRMEIDFEKGGTDYGHWWIEIDGNESYGWWPKDQVGIKDTLFGAVGELNGQTNFPRGSATRDPHHGDWRFPENNVQVFAVYGTQSKAEAIEGIRNFANAYSGNWSWPLGQNCHSFQKQMLEDNGLTVKKEGGSK
jgi:hypothetical protein